MIKTLKNNRFKTLIISLFFLSPGVSFAQFGADYLSANWYLLVRTNISEGNLDKAAFEFEPAMNGNSNVSTSELRTFLFKNKSLSYELFRPVTVDGLSYFGCLFGHDEIYNKYLKRLEVYGDALRLSDRDQKIELLKDFQNDPKKYISSNTDCESAKVRYIENMSDEMKVIYIKMDNDISLAKKRLISETEAEIAEIPQNLKKLSNDYFCDLYGAVIRSDNFTLATYLRKAKDSPDLDRHVKTEAKRRKINIKDELIHKKSIYIGTSRCNLIAIKGLPTNINRTVSSHGSQSQFVYGFGVYIYLKNDFITGWQD